MFIPISSVEYVGIKLYVYNNFLANIKLKYYIFYFNVHTPFCDI